MQLVDEHEVGPDAEADVALRRLEVLLRDPIGIERRVQVVLLALGLVRPRAQESEECVRKSCHEGTLWAVVQEVNELLG